MTFLSRYRIAFLLFALALGIRLLFLPFSIFDAALFSAAEAEHVAFDGYFELAENLQAGNGFTRSPEPPYEPDSVRTPLYPYLIAGLAVLFGSFKPLFILQALLGAGAAVLAWLIAREFLEEKGAMAVGIFAAVEPLQAYLAGTILTETVFTFPFLLAILLLIRFFEHNKMHVFIVATILLGIATLVKPTIQYFPLLLLFALFSMYGKNWKPLLSQFALFTAIFVLILSPWMYRNYITFGTTMLVVQPVSNLYTYLVPSTIALERGTSWEVAVAEFFEREHVRDIDDIDLGNANEFKERALAELKQHPKGLLLSVGVTFWTFFTHDGYASILDRMGITMSFAHPPVSTLLTHPAEASNFIIETLQGPEALVLLGRLFWIVILFLSALGVILYMMRYGITPRFLLVTGLVGYFAVTTVVIGLSVNGRFRVPVDPIIFMFAVYALQTVLNKRPDGNKPIA